MNSEYPIALRSKHGRTYNCSSRSKLLDDMAERHRLRAFANVPGDREIYCLCRIDSPLRIEIVGAQSDGSCFPRARPDEQAEHDPNCGATAHTAWARDGSSEDESEDIFDIAHEGFNFAYAEQCCTGAASRGVFCRVLERYIEPRLSGYYRSGEELRCVVRVAFNSDLKGSADENALALWKYGTAPGDSGVQLSALVAPTVNFLCNRDVRGNAMTGEHIVAAFWRGAAGLEFVRAWPIVAVPGVHRRDSHLEEHFVATAAALGLLLCKPPHLSFMELDVGDWSPMLRVFAAERMVPDLLIWTPTGLCACEVGGFSGPRYGARLAQKTLALSRLERQRGLQWVVLRPNLSGGLAIENRSQTVDPSIDQLVDMCGRMLHGSND